eukprot:scaffold81728_cov47-Attheya_sp.AAC.3
MDIGSVSLANKYCRPTRNDRAAKNATKKKFERGTRATTDGGSVQKYLLHAMTVNAQHPNT